MVVKGQVRTAYLLSAVLNRDVGIRGRGLLSHVALFELPGMDRLIYLSDSGVIVYPDVSQKLEIINNVVAVARQFGLDEPKVAVLAASETVHPKIPASLDALARLVRSRDLARARSLNERALAIGEEALGPGHPEVAAIRVEHAALAWEAGETRIAFASAVSCRTAR